MLTEPLLFLPLVKSYTKMVVFNELRITDDYSKLIIDCSIENLGLYEGAYIKTIKVDFYKNATNIGVASDLAVTAYSDDGEEHLSDVMTSVKPSDFSEEAHVTSFEGGFFYVIVECDNLSSAALAAAAALPCGYDGTIDIGVILDWKLVYKYGIGYIAKATYKCNNCIPTGNFSNFIVLWHSLMFALAAGSYSTMSDIWDKFLRVSLTESGFIPISSGCGCKH